jgi:hypothetical protein
MDKEPGQLAYEARWQGMTLGPRGASDHWKDLQPAAKAVWIAVEDAVELRLLDRVEAFVDGVFAKVRAR